MKKILLTKHRMRSLRAQRGDRLNFMSSRGKRDRKLMWLNGEYVPDIIIERDYRPRRNSKGQIAWHRPDGSRLTRFRWEYVISQRDIVNIIHGKIEPLRCPNGGHYAFDTYSPDKDVRAYQIYLDSCKRLERPARTSRKQTEWKT